MKKILLLIIVLLLSGCTVEYDLEFNDLTVKEKIKIGPIDKLYENELNYLTPYAILNNHQQELYEVDYSNEFLHLNYTYLVNDFRLSETFNDCYELSNFSYDDKYYYILTSKEFKCLSFEKNEAKEIKIKFKTNHKVVNSNADSIENDTYVWIINENNKKNKPIEIKLEKDAKKKDNKKEKILDGDFFNIFTISIIIFIICIIIYKYLMNRSKKINKT